MHEQTEKYRKLHGQAKIQNLYSDFYIEISLESAVKGEMFFEHEKIYSTSRRSRPVCYSINLIGFSLLSEVVL